MYKKAATFIIFV